MALENFVREVQAKHQDALRKVSVTMLSINQNQQWYEPFNQVMFFNYDPTNKVVINNVITILPNQQLNITLNVGEVNTTNYSIDFAGSTSANLVIVYSQYLGIFE